MAIGAEEATFNTAMDTLVTAWKVLINHIGDQENIQVVFVDKNRGNLATDSHQSATAGVLYDHGRVYNWRNEPDTADSFPVSIGGMPLFWKVTNNAGEI